MERYHIFKLGLAITFYAAYCIRPMLVYSLEADNDLENRKTSTQNQNQDYFNYFQGVEGRPGLDFPVYSFIPRTTFDCKSVDSGYYADLETDCQVFHICEEGRKISFLCPNGTVFQQSELICEWWNKVNCTDAPSLYEESAEKFQNDVARRKASRKVSLNGKETNHGAVMRMEESSSIRATQNGRDYSPDRIKNHRIDNGDIEQHIQQSESNNRYLANAQQGRFANHNYDDMYNSFGAHTTPETKQTKKDIDGQTGNFINGNFGKTDTHRNPKNINFNSKNNFDYTTRKSGSYKTTSLKEYHVEFGSTNTAEDTTTQRYSSSTVSSTALPVLDQKENIGVKASTVSPQFRKTNYQKKDFGYSTSDPFTKEVARVILKENKSFRGSVRYNSKPNSFEDSKQQVTTYSPETKQGKNHKETKFDNYYTSKQKSPGDGSSQNTFEQVTTYSPETINDYKKTSVHQAQESYELSFPRHKSELNNNDFTQNTNSGGQIQVQLLGPTQKSSHKSNEVKSFETDRETSSQAPLKSSEQDETQVTQESSSFVKSSFNSLDGGGYKPSQFVNHRSTYTDIKDLSYLEAPKFSGISSITPHLVTTQPINNGKPFVGSRIGITLQPNQTTTQSKYTYLPTSTSSIIFGVLRHSSTTPKPLFNLGTTDKTLPPVETTTVVTNAIPTHTFNLGLTDAPVKPNVVPGFQTSSVKPLEIYVPEEGTLNVGQGEVNEPTFIKKTVPLLYSNELGSTSTTRSVDHATVYGTYASSTNRPNKATPYSPTVPTVTRSSSERNIKSFNQGVPIVFEKGSDKVRIQLSKSFVDQTPPARVITAPKAPLLSVKTNVRVQDDESLNAEVSDSYALHKSIEKPRPFSKVLETETPIHQAGFPAYQVSSARPFGVAQTYPATEPTIYTTSKINSRFNVNDNIDNMINVLQEIANANSNEESRPGLTIPPSVGPQTLHSLAQYFANELQSTDQDVLEPDTKEKLTTLLTQMTVHGYNTLFKAQNQKSVTTESPDNVTTTSAGPETSFRAGGDDLNEENNEFSTTVLPELRQLARNFSLALSSYLNDPENFRKSLESLRPTEPPSLNGADQAESNTGDDELLNFSDADLKPSTPSLPSPTWGYILATDPEKPGNDQVGNSLNPDLSTADSQSFVPRFNDVRIENKQKDFTDLPPNHWTSSPQATQLWQKALSVNPVVLNQHFDSSPSTLFTSDGESNQFTSVEHELYNPEGISSSLEQPYSEISYDLRELPPISLNSTQLHGILIDFMNHTKQDEHNRLNRILKKFNTSEEDFLERMKEIESNPLTKRLILLLISECGANITRDLDLGNHQAATNQNSESLSVAASSNIGSKRLVDGDQKSSSGVFKLVHPKLREEDHDARALQLLNSLYTIASKFGRK